VIVSPRAAVLEVLDPRGALVQLNHQLGNLVGESDRPGEPLLLCTAAGELGLEDGDVVLCHPTIGAETRWNRTPTGARD
jgi:hypothetical protein